MPCSRPPVRSCGAAHRCPGNLSEGDAPNAPIHKIRDVFVRKGRQLLKGEIDAEETVVGGPEDGVIGRDVGENKLLIAGAVEVVFGHAGARQ